MPTFLDIYVNHHLLDKSLAIISKERVLLGTAWWRPEGRHLTPIEVTVREACTETWIMAVRGADGPNGVNSWRTALKDAKMDRMYREAKRTDALRERAAV